MVCCFVELASKMNTRWSLRAQFILNPECCTGSDPSDTRNRAEGHLFLPLCSFLDSWNGLCFADVVLLDGNCVLILSSVLNTLVKLVAKVGRCILVSACDHVACSISLSVS